MAPEDIKSLHISVLKEILFNNHVNARLLIEKSDLVEKVTALIADERRERERQEIFRQMEEEQERLRQMEVRVETQRDEYHLDREHQTPEAAPKSSPEIGPGEGPEAVDPSDTDPQISTTSTTPLDQQATTNTPSSAEPMRGLDSRPAMAISLERNGLCVICQDEEANIAIVDCGLVMSEFFIVVVTY